MKWKKSQAAAHQADAVHQGSWINTQACTTNAGHAHEDEQYEAFLGCEEDFDWVGPPIDPGRLTRIFRAAEVRQKRHVWYLLDGVDGGWNILGGPYSTRDEARAVKKQALAEWDSLPWR